MSSVLKLISYKLRKYYTGKRRVFYFLIANPETIDRSHLEAFQFLFIQMNAKVMDINRMMYLSITR